MSGESSRPEDRAGSSGQDAKISTITPAEIREVLAAPGYSADGRKAWLREVLADLQRDGATSPERQRLLDEVKAAIDDNQDGSPIAEDTI